MNEDEKRQYITDARSHSKNILVDAGAGAGKTRLIVERVAGQIKAGVPAEKIVLITFTNAAANELYERIQTRLTKLSAESVGKEKKLFEKALMDIQRMKISTIHSFCLSLISEQPFEAKLHLGLSLADDSETKQEQAAFFERYYRSHMIDTDDYGFYNSADKTKMFPLSDRYVKKYLCKSFIDCAEYRDVEFVRDHSYDSVSYDSINRLAYGEIANYLNALVLAFYDGSPKGDLDSIKEFLVKDITKYLTDDNKVYFKDLNYCEACIGLFSDAKNGKPSKYLSPFNKTKTKKLSPKCNDNMAYYVPKNVDKIKRDYFLYIQNKITSYVEQAVKAYQQSDSKDSVSNDGLLYHTHELLENSAEARAFFRKKYSCIYIDEFQDTDVMQAELLLYLCADESELSGGKDIWDCPLRDGSLFIVGDPKQSIYSFRNADIRLYNKMRSKFENDTTDNCVVFDLEYNYRSNAELISWVNEKFEPAIDGKSAMTYKKMLSKAPKAEDTHENDICGSYILENGGAETVAAEISRLVNCGGMIFDGSCRRKIEYSDFLVLLWNTTHMAEYVQALSKYKIPYTMWGKRKQSESIVLKRFITLADLVFNSLDPSAKETAYELIWNELPNNGYDYDDEEFYAKQYVKNLEDIDGRLLNVKALTDTADEPMAKLYKLLECPELLFSGVEEKRYELANLIYLLEKWQKQGFAGKAELLAAMRKELDAVKEKELLLSSAGQDRVRIMNLHKSKGLEGNIVIMAEAKDPSYVNGIYTDLVDKKQVFVPAYKSGFNGLYRCFDCLDLYPAERALAEEKYTGEQLRLEYVAATRAKQAFIFADCKDKRGKLMGEELTMRKVTKKLPELASVKAADNSEVPAALSDVFTKVNISLAAFDEAKNKLGEKCTEKITPSHLEDGAKVAVSAGVPTIVYERPKGRAIGHMVHRAFELAVDMREKLLPYAETDEQKLLAEKIVSRAYIDFENECGKDESEKQCREYVAYQLESLLRDKDLGALLNSAQAVYTELPFYKNDSGRYVNGVMDLVLKMSDKNYVIIDYKSNIQKEADRTLFEQRMADKYSSQLGLYEKVLREMLSLGNDCTVESHIYYMNDEKYKKTVSEGD